MKPEVGGPSRRSWARLASQPVSASTDESRSLGLRSQASLESPGSTRTRPPPHSIPPTDQQPRPNPIDSRQAQRHRRPKTLTPTTPSPPGTPIPSNSSTISRSKSTRRRDEPGYQTQDRPPPNSLPPSIPVSSSSTSSSNPLPQPRSAAILDPIQPKQRLIRPPRPNKRLASSQDQNSTHPTQALDEDDFFNLSSHKPIRFVSKTLGLQAASPGRSSITCRQSLPTYPSNVIDLSDQDEPMTSDEGSHHQSDHDRSILNRPKSKSNHVPRHLPTWTKSPHLIQLDGSSDEEPTTLPSTTQQVGTDHSLSQKRTKSFDPSTATDLSQNIQPSKSRSPTPPPLPNQDTLLRTMEDVYQALSRKDQLSTEPKRILAALQRQEEIQLKRALDDLDPTSTSTPSSIRTPDRSRTRAPSRIARGPTTDPKNLGRSNDIQKPSTSHHTHLSLGTTITLSISMVLDPRIAARSLQQQVDDYQHPILYTMKSAERFQVIYDEFHRRTNLPMNRLVVSHDDIKLSPFVTPESIRIYSQATLKVYESSVWEYVSSLRRQRLTQPSTSDVGPDAQGSPTRLANLLDGKGSTSSSWAPDDQPIDRRPTGTLESSTGTSSFKHSSPPNPAEDRARSLELMPTVDSDETAPKLISITVRTKDRRSVELLVRSTTTIRSIVKNFLSEIGHPVDGRVLTELSKFKILFDGQELEPSSKVSDHEICDEDILDFIFL